MLGTNKRGQAVISVQDPCQCHMEYETFEFGVVRYFGKVWTDGNYATGPTSTCRERPVGRRLAPNVECRDGV